MKMETPVQKQVRKPLSHRFWGGALVLALFFAGICLWLENRSDHHAPSIRVLIRALGRQETASDAVRAVIWRKLPQTFQSALPLIEPVDPVQVRRWACRELAVRGPKAEQAVPALILALNDPDTGVGLEAVTALGEIGPSAQIAVTPLLTLFEKTNSFFRSFAAFALAKIGPGNGAVIHAFTNALTNPDQLLQIEAARCLTEIARRTPLAEPALLASLWTAEQQTESQPWMQAVIIRALGKLENPSPVVLKTLLEHFDNNDNVLRMAAAGAAADLGTNAARAVPHLIDMFGKIPKSAPARFETSYHAWSRDMFDNQEFSLWSLPWAASSQIGVPLESSSRLTRPTVTLSRFRILHALALMGPAAMPAVPLLEEECRDEANPARVFAAMCRWNIDGNCSAVMRVFEDALRQTDAKTHGFVLSCIAQMPTRCPETISLLIEVLRDPEKQMSLRVKAINQVARLGVDALPAIEALCKLSNDPGFAVRFAAEKALAELEPLRLTQLQVVRTNLRSDP